MTFEKMDWNWTKIPREVLQVFFWQVAKAIAQELKRTLSQDFVRARPGPNGEPIVVPMNLNALKAALFLYSRYLPLSRAAVAGGCSGSRDRDMREKEWLELTMELASSMHRVVMSLLTIEPVCRQTTGKGQTISRFLGRHVITMCRMMQAFNELSLAAVGNVPARLGSAMRRQFATACMMQNVGFGAVDAPDATECDILRQATPEPNSSVPSPDIKQKNSKRGRRRRTLYQLTGLRGRVEFIDKRPVWRPGKEAA